jgi:hypothetical protein
LEGGNKVSFCVTENEGVPFLVCGSENYCTSRMIQRRSKVLNRLNRKSRKFIGQSLLQSDFVECVQSVRINLGDSYAFVRLEKLMEEQIAPFF